MEFLEFFRPVDFIALCAIEIFITVSYYVGRAHFIDEFGATVVPDLFKPAIRKDFFSFTMADSLDCGEAPV